MSIGWIHSNLTTENGLWKIQLNIQIANCLFFCLIKLIIFLGSGEIRGNSTVVSVSVCQADRPGSSPARSACFRKVGFYQRVTDLFPPVPMTGSTKAAHVLSCLCVNACKTSLAICCNSRTSCPVSRPLTVPIYGLHVLNKDVNMIQTN